MNFIRSVITNNPWFATGKINNGRAKKRLVDILSAQPVPTANAARSSAGGAPDVEREISEAKRLANRDLKLSLGLMGTSAAGALFFPPLGLLSVPGLLYLAWPFIKNTIQMGRKGQVGVDTLTTLVIGMVLLNGYFFVMGVAIASFCLSRKLILKVKDDSHKNLVDVFSQQPRTVWILVDELEVDIPFEQLEVGNIAIGNAGEVIPADGTVIDGYALVDQHILTGEAQPAEKEVGDEVFASTVVLSGKISIRVEKSGEESTVAKIGHILNNTADFKSNVQLKAQSMADRTIWPTILLSGAALPFIGPGGVTAILYAHFKYRMDIVAPISILSYFSLLSRNGILVKDGRTLDLLNTVDTVIFDKTGTLTQKQPHAATIYTCAGHSEDDVLMAAAAAEQKQTHPIARAILDEARQREIRIPEIDETDYQVGYGLTVTLEGKLVRVGSKRFMQLSDIGLPPIMIDAQETCHRQGHSLVMVAVDGVCIGAIELIPTVRPEAKTIIQQLKQRRNIESTYIISGDHEAPTKKLAHDLGIDHYFAETLPENKAQIIQQLQAEGKSVCFIGDGINDSIALKTAAVSVSLRGASTIATDTAQIILMDASLNQLPYLFGTAEDFGKNINFGFSAIAVSTLMGIGGALFFHFGLLPTIVVAQSGLLVGVVSGLMPRLGQDKREDTQQNTIQDLNGIYNKKETYYKNGVTQ